MRPHQKLEAWSKAIELVTDVLTADHPGRLLPFTICYLPFTGSNYGTTTKKKDARISHLYRPR
jgi:hypothetical protein